MESPAQCNEFIAERLPKAVVVIDVREIGKSIRDRDP
jgi:hypothetical protein